MFSGIVEEVGTIRERTEADGGVQISIGCALVLDDLAAGASVAVDGVCQTVVSHDSGGFVVHAGGATLDKTTLRTLRVGDRVNLERALAVGSRLNGHFVQGHVNATGTVHAWQPFDAAPAAEGDTDRGTAAASGSDDETGTWRFEIDIPDHLRRYVAAEGSLTVNGVSLTVAKLAGSRVTFSIIPYTAHHTALRDRTPGASVNLEVDMIAKYLESLHTHGPAAAGARVRGPAAEPAPVTCGVAAAAAELAAGGMIIVTDHAARENEGDLVIAAEHATPAAVNFMVTHGRGMVCVPLTAERAAALDLAPMAAVNSALHSTAFTVSVDYRHGTTTGISAADRAATIVALADSDAGAGDFARPGHMFPIIADPGGVHARPGHTEAAVELMRMAGCRPVAVICEIMAADGSMAGDAELMELARTHGLPVVSVEQVAEGASSCN
ncbi:MAG: 3,4-dihydroxy-2-butanone-4-phosphate synthase [Spirochaetaceae bacterium]|nr:3,4-dihydroxy-2-butanone-4-phosphate synthase [Spirochaetaceae bacterium]